MHTTAVPADNATKPGQVLTAYDWEVVTTTDGDTRQRAVGRTDDYDRACDHVVDALGELSPGIMATGTVATTFPATDLPARPVAAATRASDGSITWAFR